MNAAAGQGDSLLRVVHGSPTPEELAAAVAVVLAAVQRSGPAAPGTTAPARAPWRRAESPPSSLVSWRGGR
ncbi:acyl-CoA carboxylase epsilon subunit [Streptomyces sp. B1I3]|uniref:acyl-CoA carboxylase epsilon subunit n=1 Tax=Streptomyces sp. B1I3 TaxID=3042264 RepID=UPI0027839152|nr:acyl-CoA carboxylase epsilon subunit [Streptomyces sp. B1I3]MDQ0795470.1 phage tail sheath gpL-like [Streptomyces sp. B1I3]